MLAPMVRSGSRQSHHFTFSHEIYFDLRARIAVPTRLFSLKYGAQLVWSPEIVDKAILHSQREVDRKTDLSGLLSARSDG